MGAGACVQRINWPWGDGDAFYALREGSVDLIDRETLAVRASLPVAAEYAYAYELGGALIVIVADGKMLALDMEGRALFRGDVEEMTLSSSFTACEGVPDRPWSHARRSGPSRELPCRPAPAPRFRALPHDRAAWWKRRRGALPRLRF